MKKYFSCLVKHWVPVGVVVACLGFVILLVNQQNLRMSANDPQIQIAEDTAALLSVNKAVAISEPVDIAKSLAVFTIVYDQDGKVVNSTGVLNNVAPVVPKGVLLTAKANGSNKVTWQPQAGVRIASVTVPYKGGYVLVGRNLREVEIREDQQQRIILLGVFASFIFTFVAVAILEMIFFDSMPKKKK